MKKFTHSSKLKMGMVLIIGKTSKAIVKYVTLDLRVYIFVLMIIQHYKTRHINVMSFYLIFGRLQQKLLYRL